MKKVICFLLAAVLLLGMAGCKKQAAQGNSWQTEYDLGVRYLNESRYDDAIAAFRMAIEIDPKQKSAYIGLANTYKAMNDIEKAIEILFEALDKLGEDPEILAALEALGVFFEDDYTTADGMFRVELDEAHYALIKEDDSGNMLRQEIYTKDDALERYFLYEYNGQSVLVKETEYLPDDSLSLIAEYRDDGSLEKVTQYDPDGGRLVSYIRPGGTDVIEDRERMEQYGSDGSLQYYVLTSHDAAGNRTGDVSYYPDGSVMSEEGYIFFDRES